MKGDLYEAIFKRKTFHIFKGVGHDRITAEYTVV